MGRKLYVGNPPHEVGDTELQDLVARAGSVESVAVMRGQTPIRGLNASQVGGRSLTVDEARRRW